MSILRSASGADVGQNGVSGDHDEALPSVSGADIGLSSISFRDLVAAPRAHKTTPNARKRKVAHAEIITSSPFKLELEKAKDGKNRKRIAKKKV